MSEVNTKLFTAFSMLLQKCNGVFSSCTQTCPFFPHPSSSSGTNLERETHAHKLVLGLGLLKLHVPHYSNTTKSERRGDAGGEADPAGSPWISPAIMPAAPPGRRQSPGDIVHGPSRKEMAERGASAVFCHRCLPLTNRAGQNRRLPAPSCNPCFPALLAEVSLV